jgi:methionyl-tRNA synthetase
MINSPFKPTINFDAFAALDLRVGQVIKAEVPDWSETLIELAVDFGESVGQRTVFTGVKRFYQPADFVGKKFIFVVNLAEKKMGPGVSQGMMLMATDEANQPIKLDLPQEISVGCVVC